MPKRPNLHPLALAAACVPLLVGRPAFAQPSLGASLRAGESRKGHGGTRVGAAIHMFSSAQPGWQLGAELGASMASYLGGYGCRTDGASKHPVPSIAVVCLLPRVSAHGLVGLRARASGRGGLHAQLGAGVAASYVVPSRGGETRGQLQPSFLTRAGYLFQLSSGSPHWSLGPIVELRVLGVSGAEQMRFLGLQVEGSL
jgi:hypothetical protein